MTTATITLFEKLGGKPAVQTVVGEFYKKVLADDQLKGFFKDTDMPKLEQSQINFLTMALGGPNHYKGASMKDAHKGMGITDHHFGLVAGHLIAALKGAGVPQEDVDAVVALVGPLKADIVGA